MVSSKDCGFVKRVVPGLHGYSCINSIEVQAGGYIAFDERALDPSRTQLIERLYEESLRIHGGPVYIERKTLSIGVLAGFSIDWRGSGTPPPGLRDLLEMSRREGLYVLEYSTEPFVDIYVVETRKSSGVVLLKKILGVDRVVYVGDSENDVPAFRVSDVSVFVRHRYNRGLEVEADYEIEFERLGEWLVRYAGGLV